MKRVNNIYLTQSDQNAQICAKSMFRLRLWFAAKHSLPTKEFTSWPNILRIVSPIIGFIAGGIAKASLFFAFLSGAIVLFILFVINWIAAPSQLEKECQEIFHKILSFIERGRGIQQSLVDEASSLYRSDHPSDLTDIMLIEKNPSSYDLQYSGWKNDIVLYLKRKTIERLSGFTESDFLRAEPKDEMVLAYYSGGDPSIALNLHGEKATIYVRTKILTDRLEMLLKNRRNIFSRQE